MMKLKKMLLTLTVAGVLLVPAAPAMADDGYVPPAGTDGGPAVNGYKGPPAGTDGGYVPPAGTDGGPAVNGYKGPPAGTDGGYVPPAGTDGGPAVNGYKGPFSADLYDYLWGLLS